MARMRDGNVWYANAIAETLAKRYPADRVDWIAQIVWRAVALHGDVLWQQTTPSPKLRTDALDEVLDRRLRVVERMACNVNTGGFLNATSERGWVVSGPNGPWSDRILVRLFDYPFLPRSPSRHTCRSSRSRAGSPTGTACCSSRRRARRSASRRGPSRRGPSSRTATRSGSATSMTGPSIRATRSAGCSSCRRLTSASATGSSATTWGARCVWRRCGSVARAATGTPRRSTRCCAARGPRTMAMWCWARSWTRT